MSDQRVRVIGEIWKSIMGDYDEIELVSTKKSETLGNQWSVSDYFMEQDISTLEYCVKELRRKWEKVRNETEEELNARLDKER